MPINLCFDYNHLGIQLGVMSTDYEAIKMYVVLKAALISRSTAIDLFHIPS